LWKQMLPCLAMYVKRTCDWSEGSSANPRAMNEVRAVHGLAVTDGASNSLGWQLPSHGGSLGNHRSRQSRTVGNA